MEIDELNKKILNCVLENARLSYRQIAKKLKISPATVLNRIKVLEKEGIIKGYSAILNYEKLGFDISVVSEITITKGHYFDVEKKLSENRHVCGLYNVTGDIDAIIIARFKNRRELDQFLKDIQAYEYIQKSETKLILNASKEENIPI